MSGKKFGKTNGKTRRKVQVEKSGTHYKARYQGYANFVFGETPQEAVMRLTNYPTDSGHRRNLVDPERTYVRGDRSQNTHRQNRPSADLG